MVEPKVKERQRKEKVNRRRQILDAALEVFAERGYEGASVAAIAERCRLSKGLVYFYFRSKEDLFVRVVRRKFAELYHKLRAVERQSGPFEERLERLLATQLAYYRENQAFYKLLSAIGSELPALTPAFQARVRSHSERELRLFRRAIEEGLRQGAFQGDDPDKLVHALGGLIHGLALQYYRGDFDPQRLAREIVQLFLHGIARRDAR